jgi:hypothetical protein
MTPASEQLNYLRTVYVQKICRPKLRIAPLPPLLPPFLPGTIRQTTKLEVKTDCRDRGAPGTRTYSKINLFLVHRHNLSG